MTSFKCIAASMFIITPLVAQDSMGTFSVGGGDGVVLLQCGALLGGPGGVRGSDARKIRLFVRRDWDSTRSGLQYSGRNCGPHIALQ